LKSKLVNTLLRIMFYPSPNTVVSNEEEKIFDELFENAFKSPDQLITYHLPIPKYKFLHYISTNKPIVLHGSNNTEINSFEPRVQTLYDGTMSKAVFATKDPIWCIFFAVINKKSVVGNIRNGSLTTNGKQRYHFYSLTTQTFINGPRTDGMIYFLPEDSFQHISKGTIQFNEWISKDAEFPIAKMKVQPSDFYFLHKVSCHDANEKPLKTWFLYKLRTLFKKKS
jgi:hypothetical protein